PEPDETFYVNLSNPSGVTIADGQGQGTITNDDGTAPAITINDVSHNEGNAGTTSYVFTVDLSKPSTLTVTVHYATADGSAAAPGDYTAKSGTLTFNPGETRQQVTVSGKGDTAVEFDEHFYVNLDSPVNATIADG